MNHYEAAIQALAQADHVSEHPAAQSSYRREAQVHATLAIASELSAIAEELARIRGELHEMRKALRLASA